MNLQWDVRIILTLHMNHGLFFEKHTAIKNKYSFLYWLYLHSFADVNSDTNPAWYWTCGDDEVLRDQILVLSITEIVVWNCDSS